MYGMTDEFIDNQNALANAKARIAELEAELAALKARIAGGVEVLCNVGRYRDGNVWCLNDDEAYDLEELHGQRVTVILSGPDGAA